MTDNRGEKDLVILVADKDMEFTVKGLLGCYPAIGIRPLTNDVYVHPQHDPGCLLRGHDFLRLFANSYAHALIMFDLEGSGKESLSREELEHQVEVQLARSGWDDRAAVIVLDPELEIWVWSDSPEVDLILGWQNREPDLRTWLCQEGFVSDRSAKPNRPKEAFEEALKLASKPRSSSRFRQLAEKVSLNRCSDAAFLKFKTQLRQWFRC